jgi:hypothetical protein
MGAKRAITACIVMMGLLLAAGSFADLQNVTVGGQITILGEYYTNAYTSDLELRWPARQLVGRPIGTEDNEIYSGFAWDRRVPSYALVSQWTRLHIAADFTDNVGAFIEFDSVDVWGEDLRSNYLTGIDTRADTADDIEVYQAYIDANELFGVPLRLRIGRQELVFGSEWLVGNNDAGPIPIWGLSFDAIRLTYATEQFSVDAWWSKLVENSPLEADGDVDFSGIYASYFGVKDVTFDAYWLWLRDAQSLEDTAGSDALELAERLAGVDDYAATNIHTVGLRAAGEVGAFDFEAEAAYQWGTAGQVGYLFKPVLYGDDDAKYDAWTVHAVAGYTFDVAWKPRVGADYAYFSGEDNRDITLEEWRDALNNPYYHPRASVSFNRLFSDVYLSNVLDLTDLSNLHVFTARLSANPTEKVELTLDVSYLLADKAFSRPADPRLPYLTRPNDRDLGWETCLGVNYQYTDDLYFSVGWDHLFVGKGLEQGQFVQSNGLDFNGGSDDDDVDYVYFETGISF